MLVDYAVTEMGCFDNYSDDAPRAKTMRGNGITIFLLHVAQCITFCQRNLVIATLIAQALLKSFDSRLGLKVIKYFGTSPNFEKDLKRFNYESGKSKSLQKKKLAYNSIKPYHNVLQLFMTIELTLTKI